MIQSSVTVGPESAPGRSVCAHCASSGARTPSTAKPPSGSALAGAQAAVALRGGWGMPEELLKAITLKRLGLFLGPIILVNTRGYFRALLELLSHAVNEHSE